MLVKSSTCRSRSPCQLATSSSRAEGAVEGHVELSQSRDDVLSDIGISRDDITYAFRSGGSRQANGKHGRTATGELQVVDG